MEPLFLIWMRSGSEQQWRVSLRCLGRWVRAWHVWARFIALPAPPANVHRSLPGRQGPTSGRDRPPGGPANGRRMNPPMKSLESPSWPAIRFPFSRTALRSVPAHKNAAEASRAPAAFWTACGWITPRVARSGRSSRSRWCCHPGWGLGRSQSLRSYSKSFRNHCKSLSWPPKARRTCPGIAPKRDAGPFAQFPPSRPPDSC